MVESAAGLGRSRRIDAGRGQQLHRDVGRDGADDRGAALATKPGLGRLRRRLRDPVALVQHDEIGGGELAVDGVPEPLVLVARANRLGVGKDHDEVARKPGMQGRDVGDGGRVRDAARLHQDLLRGSISVQQAVDGAHEVVPHGAADASVRERNRVSAVRGDEVSVDVQLAEVVDEHHVAHPVAAGEHAVEERRLAGAEEAADDAHRHPDGHDSPPGRACADMPCLPRRLASRTPGRWHGCRKPTDCSVGLSARRAMSRVYTYYVRTQTADRMNVTLSIDEQVVAKARHVAAVRGTSLNQLIRDYLDELTRPGDVESALDQLDALWSGSGGRSQDPWTREELHERS